MDFCFYFSPMVHDTHGPVFLQGARRRLSSMVLFLSTGIGGGFGYHPSQRLKLQTMDGKTNHRAKERAHSCSMSVGFWA